MRHSFGNDITHIGETTFRNRHVRFGIKRADRLAHMYAIGKTGTGKTTLLETLIQQDIAAGNGFALIDPHGDLAERIVASVPQERVPDVFYLNAPDVSQPYGYNPLKWVLRDKRPLAASGLLDVFKSMWAESWGARMEHILRNAILALLDYPRATLPDILRLLTDTSFRRQIASHVENQRVQEFWLKEYPHYPPRTRAEAIIPIQNKVGAFLADPNLNRILTQPERVLHIRKIMDEGKILLVNVAKGRIGSDAANILGGLLVTTIGLAAFSRAEVEEDARRDFYLYIDEFQNFTTLSLTAMASELRKYHVGLVLANQYTAQLEPDIRDAVFGNVGTLISFRVGPRDAALLAKEFDPVFSGIDLMSLPNYHVYLKLMIDGTPSRPFSARTLPPDT